MHIKAILDELSERRVYRATAVYAVVVFALWQAADIALPALGLPQAVMRYIVAGAILGLPVVVVLSWIYDVRIDGALRFGRTARRVIGFGLLAVLVLAVGVMLLRRSGGQATPTSVSLPFEFGVEEFFSGNLGRAAAIFEGIASDASDPRGNQRDALRYLVRSYSREGLRDQAMDAVRRLLALEPPIALMAPSVETDSVMAVYYDARREALGAAIDTGERSAVEAIEVFAFVDRTRLPDAERDGDAQAGTATPGQLGLGEGIASVLVNELAQRASGIKVVDRGIVGGEHGFELYRFLESPGADRIIRPTHLVFGSIAGDRESRVLLSAWAFEASTGRLMLSSQAMGQWEDLQTTIARLSDDLMTRMLQDRDPG